MEAYWRDPEKFRQRAAAYRSGRGDDEKDKVREAERHRYHAYPRNKERRRAYYVKNREKSLAASRLQRERDPEKYLSYLADYRRKNGERMRIQQKEKRDTANAALAAMRELGII